MRTIKWLAITVIAAVLAIVAGLNDQSVVLRLGVGAVDLPLSVVIGSVGCAGLVAGLLACWRPPRAQTRVFRT